MPYDTDQRLKSALDTNQLAREQLCRAVLALDKRFSDVRPRHPRGGPDGGHDLDAMYRDQQVAFGAVGFVNQANDSAEQKRVITKKFSDDLAEAVKSEPKPSVFVFMTNINLTLGEKADLEASARAQGFAVCEIKDRERLRIALDDTDGFAARFQYLGIALSESEQASFFAKWGDDIQSVVATGFQRIEGTLAQLVFLSEAADVLDGLYVHFELDRTYDGDEIGHFRCFCSGFLRGPKHRIFGLKFGSSDKSERFRTDINPPRQQRPGISHGVSSGSWEEHIDFDAMRAAAESGVEIDKQEPGLVPGSTSSSVGHKRVRTVSAIYSHDDPLFRFRPRLSLRDLDEFSWVGVLNAALAEKVVAIHVFANGYKLDEMKRDEFTIDRSEFDDPIPHEFTPEEMADPWVRIRPKVASLFQVRFRERTPARMFPARRTQPTRPPRADD